MPTRPGGIGPRELLAFADAPITVTIDRKASYGDDDMKVIAKGDYPQAIGKKLPREQVTGESCRASRQARAPA